MITLDQITKQMGARLLFENISATFHPGERYGLTGPNGAGKSTLLKIVMGQIEPTSGHVTLPDKVGFLRQDIEAFKDVRVIDTVIMGNRRLWSAFEERDRLYEGEMTDSVGIRLGELEEVIGEEDGYSSEAKAEELLHGMGVDPDLYQKKTGEIPTDRQFRVLLCQALFGDPQALLLDEPTNHLDLESIGWLETFLHSYSGILIVVSHDRHFLNAVTTQIADIDYDTLIVYPGNYDQMVIAKMGVREKIEQENKAKEKKVAQLRQFVSKFSAGTRASQVQSRIKEINKLQGTELKKSNIQRPYIRFYPPEKVSGELVFGAKRLCKAYDHPVLKNFSVEVFRGNKIGVIGNNGMGKTTLLKMLAGVLEPDDGSIKIGHNVNVGYFAQNHEEIIDKKQKINAFDYLRSQKDGVNDEEIRSVLGKMLFSGDDAFKPLSALSGGETARLIIAKMMLLNHNVIILDEPNNHLDLEAVSALSWAIQDYKGTVLFATHDRDLLADGADRIIALEKEGPRVFDGPFEEYYKLHHANV